MNIYTYIIYMCANYSKYVRNNKGLYIYTIYIYIFSNNYNERQIGYVVQWQREI